MIDLYIIPTIGSSGVFKLAPPFDTKIDPNAMHVVKSIRSISELEADSVDVKDTIYLSNNISENVYNDHVMVDMHIVTLQSGYGQYVRVPASYILDSPRIDGVPYRRYKLVVSIPPVPVDNTLDLLNSEIQDLVTDYIGADSKVSIVETSALFYIPDAQHDLEKSARALKQAENIPLTARVRSLQADNQKLRDKIALLEQYIVTNGL